MKQTDCSDTTVSGGIATLLAAILIMAAFVGWVLNLVQIAETDHFTGMLILRAIGIFFMPMGAILGWV